jgi:5''-nucleotidase/2'',3''-cyclic phosphodiesterase and related esterases
MLKKTSLLFGFLALPLFLFASEIAIFHTSDTHGFYFPRKVSGGKVIGGFALVKGYIDEYKGPYLLLDSGDYTSGTLEAKESKGQTSIKIMNEMGYNATTIGNHEGDFKEPQMLKNLKDFKFDVLAANVHDKETRTYPESVKPYNVYEVGGKKFAVIGIAKDPLPDSKRIKTSKGRKELKKALYELDSIPHDVTILLIHNSIADDKHAKDSATMQLVKDYEDKIDLVLGGHAHKILQRKVDGVTYVESGSETKGLSEVILNFDDETGKLTDIKAKYVELDSTKIKPNTKIQEFVEEQRIPGVDEVIGKALTDIRLRSNNPSELDSSLGDLFADIIKAQAPQADFALHNTGGVRVDILEGDITKRLVTNAFPFPNKVMLVRVNGAFIRKLIAKSIHEKRSLFQYSNNVKIEYRWKHNRPEVISIKVDGKEIDKDKMYLVAVNDYIANGGSEGYMFKKITDKKVISDKYLSDYFTDYITANPQGIKAPATGRIKKVK